MVKCYKGDIGTEIRVDCGVDISSASRYKLVVKKASKETVEWDAEIYDSTYLTYIVQSGDFNRAGTYLLQAKITQGNWSGLGETTSFEVHDPFK